jgi:hypothetical protein
MLYPFFLQKIDKFALEIEEAQMSKEHEWKKVLKKLQTASQEEERAASENNKLNYKETNELLATLYRENK